MSAVLVTVNVAACACPGNAVSAISIASPNIANALSRITSLLLVAVACPGEWHYTLVLSLCLIVAGVFQLLGSAMLGLGNSFCNSDADGMTDNGAPVSTVSQSEHIMPSDVFNQVKTPIVPRAGNPEIGTGKDTDGSITGSGADQRGMTPITGAANHTP